MTRSRLPALLAMAVLFVLALPALTAAHQANDASPTMAKATITITKGETLNGKMLKPGKYTVEASNSNVLFIREGRIPGQNIRNRRVEAQAAIQWKDTGEKPAKDGLILNGDIIQEIHFADKNEVAVVIAQ